MERAEAAVSKQWPAVVPSATYILPTDILLSLLSPV
jgi:hypothetical protein